MDEKENEEKNTKLSSKRLAAEIEAFSVSSSSDDEEEIILPRKRQTKEKVLFIGERQSCPSSTPLAQSNRGRVFEPTMTPVGKGIDIFHFKIFTVKVSRNLKQP